MKIRKNINEQLKQCLYARELLIKDSIERNRKFSEKYKLKYPLGSDEGKNCQKLGIWIEKSMYGKTYMGVVRTTYLIDPNGLVAETWTKVKSRGHAKAVFERLKEIKG